MASFLLQLQKIVVTYKSPIIRLFHLAEAILVVVLAVGIYLSYTRPDLGFPLYELGRRFGYIGLSFYLTSLLPGILSRLRWVPLLGTMLMPFRRHLGVMMFLCVFIHQAFTTTLPSLVYHAPLNLSISTMNPKIFGIAAILVIFPLWLTSNDTSQKYLGKKWKLLHRLTYVALLLIFLHVAYFRKRWAIPTGTVLVLEAYSWLVVWWRNRHSQTTSPVSPPTEPINPPPTQ